MRITQPHTLPEYRQDFQAPNGDNWQQAIRSAAVHVMEFALQVTSRAEENFRLLQAIEGQVGMMAPGETDAVLQKLRDEGALSWDPYTEPLLAAATPTTPGFSPSGSGNSIFLTRTVTFSDQVARPLAIAVMNCVKGRVKSPHIWKPLYITLLGKSSDGYDVDRPIIKAFYEPAIVVVA